MITKEQMTKLREAIVAVAESAAEVAVLQRIDEGYDAYDMAQSRAYRATDNLDEVLEDLFGGASGETPN